MDNLTPQAQEVSALVKSSQSLDPDDLERHARQFIAKYPYHFLGWFSLGCAYKKSGKFIEAIEALKHAVLVDDTKVETRYNLANTYKDLGLFNEAISYYQQALHLNPSFYLALNNLGLCFHATKRITDAQACFAQALIANPHFVEAFNNQGITYLDQDDPDRAESSFRRALAIAPSNADAHINLGKALVSQRRYVDAEFHFRQGIAFGPQNGEFYGHLANVLVDLGLIAQALSLYRKGLELSPNNFLIYSNLLFSSNYSDKLPGEFEVAKLFGRLASSSAAHRYTTWASLGTGESLRVGFVSGDFRQHSVGLFLQGLVENLSPKRIIMYAFSTSAKEDRLTHYLRSKFQHWVSIVEQSDEQAAGTIHDLGIHVLVDLAGHSAHNRLPLFAFKPAPVQVSWLGYFATTGLPEMDYFLGDPQLIHPGNKKYFVEKTQALPKTWFAMSPPGDAEEVKPLPAMSKGKVTFGCFSNLSKVNNRVVSTWAQILLRVPHSELFVKTRQFADEQVKAQFIKRFEVFGIPRERLVLQGPSALEVYFMAYSRVDFVLDTFPYPGGTTTVQALWMGVPVLTLCGHAFVERLGYSILENASLGHWVAHSEEDYIRKAVRFSCNLDALSQLRMRLRSQLRASPLFNVQGFANDFEQTLWTLYSDKLGAS